MADNVNLNASTTDGADLRTTEDDNTKHHQHVIIELGAGTGAAEKQVSDSNPVPVYDAGSSLTVDGTVTETNSAAILADTASMDTNLGTIAGDTTSLNGKVTACDTGAVTVAASALPSGAATAANQLPDGHNVTVDNVGGVEVVQNTAADLNCTEASAADIKTVVEAIQSGQLADGHNVTVDNAAGAAAVNIQDGGNTITVDGTVTANAGTNLNTSALATQATLNSLNTKVTACNTGSVTVISVVPGTGATNLGKTVDAVGGATDTGVVALVQRKDTLATLTPADGDYVRLRTNNRGALWMKPDGNVTVDGTVTANLGTIAGVATETTAAAILADTAAMDTNLATIAGGTTSIDGKITACDTGAVVVASGTVTAVTNITNDVDVVIKDLNGDSCMDEANNALNVNVVAGGAGGGDVVVKDLNGDSCMDEANDALRVNIVAGAGSGGTAMTDDAAFTPGSTSVTPIAGTFDDVAPDSVDEGDAGAVRMSANRNLYSTIRDAAGNERGVNVDASNQLAVADATAQGSLATIAGNTTSLDGKVTACNTGAVVVASGDITETNSAAILADTASIDTNAATIASDTTSIDGKITACNTGAIVVASGAITETNSTAILADTANIDTNVATVAGDTTSLDGKITTIDVDGTAGTDDVQAVALKLAGATGQAGGAINWVPCESTATIKGVPVALYNGASAYVFGTSPNPIYVTSAQGVDAIRVQGNEDHGAADTGGPAKIGGKANAAEPAAVDENDRVNAWFDLTGHQHVKEASAASILADTTAILADTASIDTNAATVAGAVSGSEMQVDVVAALPAGTNAIGKLAANSGVDIGDVDVTSLPSSIQGPGNPTVDSYGTAPVNLAANTANQSIISAPGASKQIWIYGLFGTVDVAGTISIQDEDDTAGSGVMPVAITGGFVMNPSGNFAMPWFKFATNKAVEIDTVTCTFDGVVTYAVVSV